MTRSLLDQGYRAARRIAIAVIGGSVVAIGVAMLVLPGPAFVVIPAGLAILALEFAWARHWLQRARTHADALLQRARGNGASTATGVARASEPRPSPPR